MSVDVSLLNEGRSELNNAAQELDRLRRAVIEASRKVQSATTPRDPFPTMFVGIVENYRFTTGAKGSTPSHRFEVLCGNGLFLHVDCDSNAFAEAMRDMSMGEITSARLNNKLIIVQRRADGMYPVRMLPVTPIEDVSDKWGNYLYEGATCLYEGQFSVTLTGESEFDSETGSYRIYFMMPDSDLLDYTFPDSLVLSLV